MTPPKNRLRVVHQRCATLALTLAVAAASVFAPHARAQEEQPPILVQIISPGVFAVGSNPDGELGDGTTTDSTAPVAVRNANGFTNTGVTVVAGGGFHSLAVQNGAAFAWGRNPDGELGNGTFTVSSVPVAVSTLTSGVTAVAGGGFHSLAVQSGAAFAWGFNKYGELGNGTTTVSSVPVAVSTLTSGVTAVAGGGFHSLAVQSGAAFAWGYNNYGQLGNGTKTDSLVPVAVSTLTSGVTAVAGGGFHSLAVQNGAAFAWGLNGNGELGNGTITDSLVPVAVSTLTSGVTAVAGGVGHSLALVNGQVYAWGFNKYGELGNGTKTDSLVPVAITVGSANNTIVAIAAGFTASFALDASGNLYMWGAYQSLYSTNSAVITTTPQLVATAPQGFAYTLAGANSFGAHAALLLSPTTPTITSATTATATVGTPFSYQITATNNPTGFTASNLPLGLSVDTATGLISGTVTDPKNADDYNVTLTATNANGPGAPFTLTLSVVVPPKPVIDNEGLPLGQVGVAYRVQISASNHPTSYGATGLPDGLQVDPATGLITGTPTTAGAFTVTFMATNLGGTGTQDFTLTILPPAPAITSAASDNAVVNRAYAYQIVASNNPTEYDAGNLPEGLTLNARTGLISGVVTQTGTYPIVLSAANDAGRGPEATLTLVVSEVLVLSPVITSPASASAQVGQPFVYQITASNGPTGYGAGGLPDGLTLDAASGLISGTPTAVGTSTVLLSATNAAGTGPATLTLTVTAAVAVPVKPSFTSAASASAVAGQPFTYLVTATGNPTVFAAEGLPAGLTLDAATGLISGTPTVTGSFPVTLTASGAGGTGTATLTLTVTATAVVTPTITSPASASAQVGQVFSYQVTATNAPTGFAASGLPDGLSINAAGLISGTPTAVGTSTVALSATNAGGSGTVSVTLTVTSAAVVVPVINSAASASAQVGVAFSYQITAANAPVFFGATNLPEGLSIDDRTGLITGAPTVAGTYTIKLVATNSAGTATASLTVTVAAQPLPVVTVIASVPRVMVGTGQSAAFGLTRKGEDTSRALTVRYTVGGAAKAGVDYFALKGTKTFKPGKTTVRISVTPVGADTFGTLNQKKVKLMLQPGDGYILGTTTAAKVHILAP